MDICLIIARHSEDLKWLDQHKDLKIIVYNKGKELKNLNHFEVINLENVGRESHTWLYHIVKNYDQLNEVNIFLQGKISDLNCMAFSDPKDYLKKINRYGFSVSRFGLLGPFHWKWNIGIENDKRYKIQWLNNEITKSKIGFRNFALKMFPKIPLFVATSYGGCFAVKKENILQYDVSFYQNLLNILEESQNPIEGHYMERLWCYIFTRNKPLLESYLDVIKTKIERLNFNKLYNILSE